jgi:hypothetical protein
MDDATLHGLMAVARDEANRLIAQGMPKQQAVDIACRALCDLVKERSSGLGQEPLTFLTPEKPTITPEPVKKVHEAISPWLWIFSVVGFGMAILNTHRIARIYGGWRESRRAVKEGRIPA